MMDPEVFELIKDNADHVVKIADAGSDMPVRYVYPLTTHIYTLLTEVSLLRAENSRLQDKNIAAKYALESAVQDTDMKHNRWNLWDKCKTALTLILSEPEVKQRES